MLLGVQWSIATEKSSIEIQQFRDSPGIYYEEIGTVNIFSDTWNLIIHMDLEFLGEQEYRTINHLRTLQETCKGDEKNHLCIILTESVDHLVKKIKENMGILHDLIGGEHPRQRRGLIDGLGSLIKSITGNMDASDAEKIATELRTVRANEETLKSSLYLPTTPSSGIHDDSGSLEDVIKTI